MKKSRFSEHQISKILQKFEAGRTAKDVCREYGVRSATYYAWKSKFGGMQASGIKRLREFEYENARLKQMYRWPEPGKPGFEGCDGKKALKPTEKRKLVLFTHEGTAFPPAGRTSFALPKPCRFSALPPQCP